PRPSAPLFFSAGFVEMECPYYVTRIEEATNLPYILQPGALVKIFAPRQYGKRSLLLRMSELAIQNGHEVITVDFQQDFTPKEMKDLDTFLWHLIHRCMRGLGVRSAEYKNDLDAIWAEESTEPLKFMDFFQQVLM